MRWPNQRFVAMAIAIGLSIGCVKVWERQDDRERISRTDEPLSLKFIRTDNQGKTQPQGANYVIIFDPRSPKLDFKVSVGLKDEIYAKNADGEILRNYVPKRFGDIISDRNALLGGKKPIAAINGDYIDPQHHPQGLNISRGVEYSGEFKNKRSSFGISGGSPPTRKATIQISKRAEETLNYNLVGGNGRFYQNGQFKDICSDLGEFACRQETNRSIVSITDKNYVILLVNNSQAGTELYPHQFNDVLEGIAKTYNLGIIQEGMLFDGGLSTALYFNSKIYVENSNPIGSVFLIYSH
jgi:Phosphodiester glycosidase